MNYLEGVEKLRAEEDSARPSELHLKFAHKMLTDLSLPLNQQSEVILAYFLRYGYVPLTARNASEAAKFIGSAPWIGLQGGDLESTINLFLKRKLLQYSRSVELDNQLVLRISPKSSTGVSEVDLFIKEMWAKTQAQIRDRRDIIKILGWTQHPATRDFLKNAMETTPQNGLVKLMVYHGRTLPDAGGAAGNLFDFAGRRNDLRFQVLVVDKKAKGRVVEGATEKENIAASIFGLVSLRRMGLPSDIMKRVDVRTYGTTDSDSLMRCLITEDRLGDIKDCVVTVWFFGQDRGVHGREIALSGDSSLALLCRNYFDNVFKRGLPQLSYRSQLVWIAVNYWYWIMTFGAIPLGCAVASLVWPSQAVTFITVAIASMIAGIQSLWRK